jgi:hypothetical protein
VDEDTFHDLNEDEKDDDQFFDAAEDAGEAVKLCLIPWDDFDRNDVTGPSSVLTPMNITLLAKMYCPLASILWNTSKCLSSEAAYRVRLLLLARDHRIMSLLVLQSNLLVKVKSPEWLGTSLIDRRSTQSNTQ